MFNQKTNTYYYFGVGLLLALIHSIYNFSLPGLFRGLICCDSTGYIQIARSQSSFWSILNYTGDRTMGYPAFLKLHQVILNFLKINNDSSWISLSFITSFTLHIISSSGLFFTFKDKLKIDIHPIFLTLMLSHPALTSHTVLPLADSICASFFNLALIASLCSSYAKSNKNSYLCSLLTGIFLGICILLRPSMGPPVGFIIFGLSMKLLYEVYKLQTKGFSKSKYSSLLNIIALLVGTILICYPQIKSCYSSYSKICLSNPTFAMDAAVPSIRYGIASARVFTKLVPIPEFTLIKDPFMDTHFGQECIIQSLAPISSLIKCYMKNIEYMPLFILKKVIGLYDNYHLNTYAVNFTSSFQKIFNRVFGLLGFLGFISVFFLIASNAKSVIRFDRRMFEPLLFFFSYFAFALNFHIESRYGFPIILLSFLFLGFAYQKLTRSDLIFTLNKPIKVKFVIIITILVSSAFFLTQTFLWDRISDYL